MKNICYIAALFLVLVTGACSKGEKVCCDVNLPDFYFYGLKADTAWLGKPNAFLLNNGGLYMTTQLSGETFGISIEDFKGKGTYKLTAFNCWDHTIVGDVLLNQYIPDDTTDNWLEIYDYNEPEGIVSGAFKVTLKRTYGNPPEAYAIQLQFLNGKFRAALSK
jgi:hypothetical protein